jgi:hypothetical protein
MARIRSIKPDFWTDEKVVQLSYEARLVYIGLWNFADDDGRMICSRSKIKMQIMPADSIDISAILDEISRLGLICLYEIDKVQYLQINGFSKHQRVDRKRASILPPPPKVLDECLRHFPKEGNGMEGNGVEGKKEDSDHRLRDDRPDNFLQLPATRQPAEDEFSAVWLQWPRKVAKAAALKAWVKARKDTDFNIIIAGLEQFVLAYDADNREESEKKQFCPHFSSWLNAERWRDYDLEPQPDRSGMTKAEKYRQIILDAGLTPLE